MYELRRIRYLTIPGAKMIFKRKPKELPKREIEFQVNIVDAQALHIKRTGSYILQLNQSLPMSECDKIIKQLKQQTGAKWVIVQGNARVQLCGCHAHV
jgi:hypothetical protein